MDQAYSVTFDTSYFRPAPAAPAAAGPLGPTTGSDRLA